MQTTYINTTTSGATQASQLNTDARAIVVKKILVGNPVNSGNIVLFNIGNALANNTTQIAFKNTFTSSVSESSQRVFDFRSTSPAGSAVTEDGIPCASGGCISIDQTMQLTVFWDYAEE